MSDSSNRDFEPRRPVERRESIHVSPADPSHQRDHVTIDGQTVDTTDDITVETAGDRKPQSKGMLREIIETALLALLIFVLVRTFVLNFKVDGNSMLPSFHDGEMLLVNRNAYRTLDAWDFVDWIPGVDERNSAQIIDWGDPERGDVIVFTPPPPGEDKPYIKRVIGLPGDHIQIIDNEVRVNGVPLDEEYIGDYRTDCAGVWSQCDVVVPEDSVYVMGDHRSNSQDSRDFGPVPQDNIIGKSWIVYWPQEAWDVVDHVDYPELTP